MAKQTTMSSRLVLLAVASLACNSVGADEPASQRALRGTSPCANRKWHFRIEDTEFPGCSNSWKVPRTANKDRLLFDSAEECCSELDLPQGQECSIMNECDGVVDLANTYCDTAKWHFDLDVKRGCTNNPRFPSSWKDPAVSVCDLSPSSVAMQSTRCIVTWVSFCRLTLFT